MAIVEGVTEFLPISSTAHLMFTAGVLGIPQTEFVKSFEIAIQLGAMGAIVALYAEKLRKNPVWVKKITIAFLPTGILGAVFYRVVKTYLLGNSWLAAGAMVVGGVILVKLLVRPGNLTIAKLSMKNALLVGLGQSVSMIPGVSRAAATMVAGMAVGMSRIEAVEFSFLLAVPTMAAATGWDLVKSGWSYTPGEWGILITGFIGAAVVAWWTVRWLVGYVAKRDLAVFGWYRIIFGVVWAAGLIFSQ